MKQRLIFVVMTLALSACGFHLRNSYTIPPQLQQLNLTLSPTSNLSPPLREALQTAGIQLDQGGYTLTVTQDKLNKQTTNTDSRAKVAEYTLLYDVRYRIAKNGEPAAQAPEHKLSLRRSYQYDTTTIVGKSEEEETLIRELYADAAQQILRQISFFKPAPAATAP